MTAGKFVSLPSFCNTSSNRSGTHQIYAYPFQDEEKPRSRYRGHHLRTLPSLASQKGFLGSNLPTAICYTDNTSWGMNTNNNIMDIPNPSTRPGNTIQCGDSF